MIIDLFIAILAVIIVVFVAQKQIKLYKKSGFEAFCSGSCTSCDRKCKLRKN